MILNDINKRGELVCLKALIINRGGLEVLIFSWLTASTGPLTNLGSQIIAAYGSSH